MGFLSWYGWYWFLFYTLLCGNSIAVSGFLFTRLEESRTRWRWRWLHRRILSLPHPFPSSLAISMCAPHSAVSIFIVKVKMENGKCKRMLHFSLHSPSIRFYHPQWTFSICGPARLCFLLLKWFHIIFLSLSLYCSLALSLSSALGSCNFCASLALCWTFSQVSRDPSKGFVCCPLPRRISFQATGQ